MALSVKKERRMSSGKSEALKEVSKEKNARFNANVPESLYAKVKIKAARENVRLNDLAIKWMTEWVDED